MEWHDQQGSKYHRISDEVDRKIVLIIKQVEPNARTKGRPARAQEACAGRPT